MGSCWSDGSYGGGNGGMVTSSSTAAAAAGGYSSPNDAVDHYLKSRGFKGLFSQIELCTVTEPLKRKRGRPRKYVTPEQALAAKKMASSASSSSAKERRNQAAAAAAGGTPSSTSGSSKKSQLGAVGGRTGQSFTPHIVNIAPGEDVAEKIAMFAQQCKAVILETETRSVAVRFFENVWMYYLIYGITRKCINIYYDSCNINSVHMCKMVQKL